MVNPVAEALEKAGQRIGKALTEDGASSITKLYDETGMRANRVVKRVGETDQEYADRMGTLIDHANDMGALDKSRIFNGKGEVVNQGRFQQREQLRMHFTNILSPASDIQHIVVDSSKHPETAAHVADAQAGKIWNGSTWTQGKKAPSILTIDRNGSDANRKASLANVPTGGSGVDRDEYPPAMFQQGGAGASVKYVTDWDNRGAGSSIGAQTRYFPDKTRVQIHVR